MKSKTTVRIKDKADRETVAQILFRNGYTTKPVEEKPVGKTKVEYYVCFWEEGIEE